MLDSLVSEYLGKVQRLQREHAEELNTFSIETRYDDYYGIYIFVSFSDDNGKYTASFLQCIDEVDFEEVYYQLVNTINDGKR